MKIALIVDEKMENGGGFQYGLTMVRAIIDHKNEDYEFLVITSQKQNIKTLKELNIPFVYFPYSLLVKTQILLHRNPAHIKRLFFKIPLFKFNPFENLIKKADIDLVYFLSPSRLALLLDHTNFITTVWDLCHRDHPEFPEVKNDVAFENREALLRQVLPRAIAVVSESDVGKANLVRRYQIDEDRIIKIPFFIYENGHSLDIDIKSRYHLDGDFIFFPAQFWAHKNHAFILESLHELKVKYHKKINAVFPGNDLGNMTNVKEYAKKLQISDQVVFPGFVSRDEIVSCYKQALAMIYPSYFGPTNIPPIEAIYFDCTVISSDLKGFREQLGDAALYVDLNDSGTLTQILIRLLENPHSFEHLKPTGKKLLEMHSKDTAFAELNKVFKAYSVKMKTWRM